jgi:hypothetical protein
MNQPTRVRLAFAALTLLFSTVLLSGCGPAGPSAEGNVTFDGRPVDGGTISFFPVGGEGPWGRRLNVSGEITGGSYSVDSAHHLQPGQYRVEIYWHKKTGRRIPSSDPPHKVEETKQVIPRKYNTQSKTIVDVTPGANTFDYALTSK